MKVKESNMIKIIFYSKTGTTYYTNGDIGTYQGYYVCVNFVRDGQPSKRWENEGEFIDYYKSI